MLDWHEYRLNYCSCSQSSSSSGPGSLAFPQLPGEDGLANHLETVEAQRESFTSETVWTGQGFGRNMYSTAPWPTYNWPAQTPNLVYNLPPKHMHNVHTYLSAYTRWAGSFGQCWPSKSVCPDDRRWDWCDATWADVGLLLGLLALGQLTVQRQWASGRDISVFGRLVGDSRFICINHPLCRPMRHSTVTPGHPLPLFPLLPTLSLPSTVENRPDSRPAELNLECWYQYEELRYFPEGFFPLWVNANTALLHSL
ncbi:unnamed protein product [Protopolystoma xenopodis]|uniref:Uncharacterized protein n=1 Tax=Protopolystoma xenopodis TaxID=117903 RepID=A0A448XLQ0_9PLAT|nr:unnamed protein product [Protopolystoma xenopodis]